MVANALLRAGGAGPAMIYVFDTFELDGNRVELRRDGKLVQGNSIAVRLLLNVHPFGSAYPVAAGMAVASYGVIGLLVRAAVGTSAWGLVLAVVVGTAVYLPAVWRFRETFRLTALRQSLRARRILVAPASFEAAD